MSSRMFFRFIFAFLLLSAFTSAQVVMVVRTTPSVCADVASEFACKHLKDSGNCKNAYAGPQYQCRKTCGYCH
ncbi:hypothetical protein Y032_0015g2874 [Ancylostoma ceylanicum]|uniref:ShKT domain-containing protein n=1 Tax=Ancylostoma ceylanicum TaxID=53326 RepID=A0A016V867_9BILA|nr:hypothetical protein Y032_0015g2874 [Ancylostoma ceylanicum]